MRRFVCPAESSAKVPGANCKFGEEFAACMVSSGKSGVSI